jgi:hypothetical protein
MAPKQVIVAHGAPKILRTVRESDSKHVNVGLLAVAYIGMDYEVRNGKKPV